MGVYQTKECLSQLLLSEFSSNIDTSSSFKAVQKLPITTDVFDEEAVLILLLYTSDGSSNQRSIHSASHC